MAEDAFSRGPIHSSFSEAPEAYENGRLKLDWKDAASIDRAREVHSREAVIAFAETNALQEEVQKCYWREGANHIQKCRPLVLAYIESLKESEGMMSRRPAYNPHSAQFAGKMRQ